ncbi:MAG: acyltransferase family protein [Spirochaetia bacterium]|nr:acyltransferase family protein [Spirochaetia bacterium]
MKDNITNQTNIANKTNYQFKILYFIGIIFVVAGHARANDLIFWNELIHCAGFYMGMFVFCSGYFYKSENDLHPVKYIVKKAKRLLIPYFLWNTFYGFVMLILLKTGFSFIEKVSVQDFLLKPLLGEPVFRFNLPSWFVIPLFFTEVYNVIIRWILQRVSENKKNILLLLLNLIIGFIGIYVAMQYEPDTVSGVMLFLTRFANFLPFFIFGYIYKMYVEKHDNLSSFWYFFIIVVIELLYILIYGHSPIYSIIGMFYFENPVLPYVMGLVGIAFWLRVARLLSPVIGASKKINLIADNTFTIMINHEFGFFILNTGFFILTVVLSLPLKFDVNKYKSAVEYIFLLRGRGFPIVYVIFGISVSLLMNFCVIKVKQFFVNLANSKTDSK